jgi:hypothetical protein
MTKRKATEDASTPKKKSKSSKKQEKEALALTEIAAAIRHYVDQQRNTLGTILNRKITFDGTYEPVCTASIPVHEGQAIAQIQQDMIAVSHKSEESDFTWGESGTIDFYSTQNGLTLVEETNIFETDSISTIHPIGHNSILYVVGAAHWWHSNSKRASSVFTIKIYNWREKKTTHTLSLRKDVKKLIVLNDKIFVICTDSNFLFFCIEKKITIILELENQHSCVKQDTVILPDGGLCVVGGKQFSIYYIDKPAIHISRTDAAEFKPIAMMFNRDEIIFVSYGRTVPEIEVWNLITKKCIKIFQYQHLVANPNVKGYYGLSPQHMLCLSDGVIACSVKSTPGVFIVDVRENHVVCQLRMESSTQPSYFEKVYNPNALTPIGATKFAALTDQMMYLWQIPPEMIHTNMNYAIRMLSYRAQSFFCDVDIVFS